MCIRDRRKSAPRLPQCSELDVVRHFTNLSKLNYSVDANFYPLGSCTMKYNPKFTEYVAALPGFARMHPLLAQLSGELAQGALQCLYDAERWLCEVTGMKAFTFQPMAGANGEYTGVKLIAAYHKAKGRNRTKMLIPDSAHGTNPASAVLAGFEIVNVPSRDGMVDPAALEEAMAKYPDQVAGLMMTNPNTLGLLELHLPRIVEVLRREDALLYYDGANMNAILGKMRVGDVGFDVVHLNVHKTLGTPHGGGGPGCGPVGVGERLLPFLPAPRVRKAEDGSYALDYDLPQSIGHIGPFYGSFAVVLKALAYMTVSYTHLDVYKRQVRDGAAGQVGTGTAHGHGNAVVIEFFHTDAELLGGGGTQRKGGHHGGQHRGIIGITLAVSFGAEHVFLAEEIFKFFDKRLACHKGLLLLMKYAHQPGLPTGPAPNLPGTRKKEHAARPAPKNRLIRAE